MGNHLLSNLWLGQNYRSLRVALALVALAVLAGVLFLAIPRPERSAVVEVVSGQPLLASNGSAFDSAPGGTVDRDGLSRSAAPSAGVSRAALSTDFHNFGTVGAREVVREDFLLYNRGSAPLVVARAYTTCGCTSGEISAGVIPPGKAARVTVIFDAGYHPTGGQTVRRGLILETNDPEHPQVEIWVQAKVKQ